MKWLLFVSAIGSWGQPTTPPVQPQPARYERAECLALRVWWEAAGYKADCLPAEPIPYPGPLERKR